MLIRRASQDDVPLLAQLNEQLLVAERHRRRLSIDALERRMAGWIGGGYDAAIFGLERVDTGYALYRWDRDCVFLRQFFVLPSYRRRGHGSRALDWLRRNTWRDAASIRLEVLVHNRQARAFYTALGFEDYAVTMEWRPPDRDAR